MKGFIQKIISKIKANKKKSIIIASAVVLVIALAIGAIFLVRYIIRSNPNNYQLSETGNISIPGYPEIEIEKNTKDVSIHLENPEGNPCDFVYEIVIKSSGEVLFTSDKIAPGEAIENAKLLFPLSQGSYDVSVKIITTSVTDGTPMNGAAYDALLIVK